MSDLKFVSGVVGNDCTIFRNLKTSTFSTKQSYVYDAVSGLSEIYLSKINGATKTCSVVVLMIRKRVS